jgi:hypothetical protein
VRHLLLHHELVALAGVPRRVQLVPAVRRVEVALVIHRRLEQRDRVAARVGQRDRRVRPVAALVLHPRARAEHVIVAAVLHHQEHVVRDAGRALVVAAAGQDPRQRRGSREATDRLDRVAPSHGHGSDHSPKPVANM